MDKSFDIMSDDEEVATELKKLEEMDDSLDLDDVEDLPGFSHSKFFHGRGRGRSRGLRGRVRGMRSRGGRGKPIEISIDDWDLDANLEDSLRESSRSFRSASSKNVYDNLEVSPRDENRQRWDSMTRDNKQSRNPVLKESKGNDFPLHKRNSLESRFNTSKFEPNLKSKDKSVKSKDSRPYVHHDVDEVSDTTSKGTKRKTSEEPIPKHFQNDPKFLSKYKKSDPRHPEFDKFRKESESRKSFYKHMNPDEVPFHLRGRNERPFEKPKPFGAHDRPGFMDPREDRNRKEKRLSKERDEYVLAEESRGSPYYGDNSPRERDWTPDIAEKGWQSSRRSRSRSISPEQERSRWEKSSSPYFSEQYQHSPPYEMDRLRYEGALSPDVRPVDSPMRDSFSPPRSPRGFHSSSLSPVPRGFPFSPEDRRLSPRRPSLSPSRSPQSPRRQSMSPPPSPRRSDSGSRGESWHTGSPQYPPHRQTFYDSHSGPPAPVYVENTYGPQPPAQYDGQPVTPYAQNYQQAYNYSTYYQQQPPPPPSYSVEYNASAVPTPPAGTQVSGWQHPAGYTDTSVQQPLSVPAQPGDQQSQQAAASQHLLQKAEEAKKEGIRNEVLQQRRTLTKQRDEYTRKKDVLLRELQLLRDQESELLAENSRDSDKILKENRKLQVDIQGKMKAIDNVIDMLTGIIEKENVPLEEKITSDKKPQSIPESSPAYSSSEKLKRPEVEDSKSFGTDAKKSSEDDKPVFNYIYYDPEMHWCHMCDVFPRTAKEFLNHLHCDHHKDITKEKKNVDTPWHKVPIDPEIPIVKGAPSKRTPIRGLQFFLPVTGWFCKLCDTWIGDLHCASLHLKSKRHAENYANFTEQNPHWETDWLTDREKAFQRNSNARRNVNTESDSVDGGNTTASAGLSDKSSQEEQSGKGIKREFQYETEKSKKIKDDSSVMKSTTDLSKKISVNITESCTEDSEADDDEEKSRSIHITMRNKAKEKALKTEKQSSTIKMPKSRWDSPEKNHETEKKDKHVKKVAEPGLFQLKPVEEDKMLKEWMSHRESESEWQLFSNLKDRLKQRKEKDNEHSGKERDDKYSDRTSSSRKSDNKHHSSSREEHSRKGSHSDHKHSKSDKYSSPHRHDKYGHKQATDKKHTVVPKSQTKENSYKSPEQNKNEKEIKPKTLDGKPEIKPKTLEVKPEIKPKTLEITPEIKPEVSDDSVFKVPAPVSGFKNVKGSKISSENKGAKIESGVKKIDIAITSKPKLPFIGRMPILKNPIVKKKSLSEIKEDELKQQETAKKKAQDALVQQIHEKLTGHRQFTNPFIKMALPPPSLMVPTSLGKNSIDAILKPYSLSFEDLAVVKDNELSKLDVQDMDIDDDDDDGPIPSVESAISEAHKSVKDNFSQNTDSKSTKQNQPFSKAIAETVSIIYPYEDNEIGSNESLKRETNAVSNTGISKWIPVTPQNLTDGNSSKTSEQDITALTPLVGTVSASLLDVDFSKQDPSIQRLQFGPIDQPPPNFVPCGSGPISVPHEPRPIMAPGGHHEPGSMMTQGRPRPMMGPPRGPPPMMGPPRGPPPMLGPRGLRPMMRQHSPEPMFGPEDLPELGPIMGPHGSPPMMGPRGPRPMMGLRGPGPMMGPHGPRPMVGPCGPRPFLMQVEELCRSDMQIVPSPKRRHNERKIRQQLKKQDSIKNNTVTKSAPDTVAQPVKKEEVSPVNKEEASPVKREETSPVKIEETSPVKIEVALPVKKEEALPVKKGEVLPVKKEEALPVKKEEAPPVSIEESTPKEPEKKSSIDLDDLALLGMDADDMAAQSF